MSQVKVIFHSTRNHANRILVCIVKANRFKGPSDICPVVLFPKSVPQAFAHAVQYIASLSYFGFAVELRLRTACEHTVQLSLWWGRCVYSCVHCPMSLCSLYQMNHAILRLSG